MNLDGGAIGPFTCGRELYSRAGNVHGSVADGDPFTFRVTFDGTPLAGAFFGIAIKKPVTIRQAAYVAGNLFHDGGWFDTGCGKSRFQVRKTAAGPWVDIAVSESYPSSTAAEARAIRPAARFAVQFEPVEGVAVRIIIGNPASGGNPAQALASCAELAAAGE